MKEIIYKNYVNVIIVHQREVNAQLKEWCDQNGILILSGISNSTLENLSVLSDAKIVSDLSYIEKSHIGFIVCGNLLLLILTL